jgi:hypothetical protein
MFATAPWYGSTTLAWTAASPIVAAIVGVLLFFAAYFPAKGRLLHSISMKERLYNSIPEMKKLKLVYDGREVGELHRITIRLASRGRQDIEFYNDQPMVFDVGVGIIDVLDCWFSDGAPTLDVVIDGSKLKVGPGPSRIIRRGETIELSALIDGPPKNLKCELPFKDVIDRSPDSTEPRWLKNFTGALFANYILVLVLYAAGSRPVEIVRPLFLYLLLMQLVVWLAALTAIWARRRIDR